VAGWLTLRSEFGTAQPQQVCGNDARAQGRTSDDIKHHMLMRGDRRIRESPRTKAN